MKIKTKPIKRNLTYAFMPMFAYVGMEFLMSIVYVLLVAFPKLADAISRGSAPDADQISIMFSEILASDSMLVMLFVNLGVLAYALYSFLRSESHEFDRRYENTIRLSDILKMAVVALGLYFSVNIAMTVLMQFFRSLGVSMNELNEAVGEMVDMNVVLAIFVVSVLAPVVEEILVRGLIFNRLRAIGSPAFAICMSSFIFAAMHFPMLVQCVYTFAVGVVFAWAYYKYENILIPIILHIFYNFCSFLFMGGLGGIFFTSIGGLLAFYFTGVGLMFFGIRVIKNKPRPEVKEKYRAVVLEESAENKDDYME